MDSPESEERCMYLYIMLNVVEEGNDTVREVS